MRRIVVSFGILLGVAVAACGSDTVTTGGGDLAATPQPPPTVPGQLIEVDIPDFSDEVVFVGPTAGAALEVRALPGVTQPLLGEVPAGAEGLDLLGEVFETDDGLVWWMVRYEAMQGWVQSGVVFPGIASDITAQLAAELGANTEYSSPEALAAAVAQSVAAAQGTTQTATASTTELSGRFATIITTDLTGLQDDSLAGYRLVITADGTGLGGNAWRLGTVFELPLCARGISPEGLCT